MITLGNIRTNKANGFQQGFITINKSIGKDRGVVVVGLLLRGLVPLNLPYNKVSATTTLLRLSLQSLLHTFLKIRLDSTELFRGFRNLGEDDIFCDSGRANERRAARGAVASAASDHGGETTNQDEDW